MLQSWGRATDSSGNSRGSAFCLTVDFRGLGLLLCIEWMLMGLAERHRACLQGCRAQPSTILHVASRAAVSEQEK
jgi:hypothetical protein